MISDDTHRTHPTPTTIVLFGCWLGLVAGLMEGAILLASRNRGPLTYVARDIGWMAPVAECLLLGGIAAGCALLVQLIGRRSAARWGVRILLFFAAGGVFAAISALNWYAVVLLAAGTSTQAARVVLRRQNRIAALVRSTLPAVILVTAVVAGLTCFAKRGPRPAASPSAARPNVILITLDTVAASHVSLYGYGRPTAPFLERLARSGTMFTRAIAPSSWTLPSHASMFTGQYPGKLSADWRRALDGKYLTLAEVLGRSGYSSGAFVANTIYCSSEHGLHRGFEHFSAFDQSAGQFLLSTSMGRKLATKASLRPLIGFYDVPGRKSARAVNEEFIDWMEDVRSRPFFAWLNYFDAHEPYLPPEPYRARFDRGHERNLKRLAFRVGSAELERKSELSRDQVEGEIDAYDAAIAYMDHELESLIAALRKSGRLSNTLVIVTSDHGEAFGENGLFSHGNSVYMPVLHVPLLLVLPGTVPTDRRVDSAVTLRDVAATVLDLAGLPNHAFDGESLRRTWTNPQPDGSGAVSELTKPGDVSSRYPISEGPLWSLVGDEMHYIRNGRGVETVFDTRADPGETRNLAAEQKGHEFVQQARQTFEQLHPGGASGAADAVEKTVTHQACAAGCVNPGR